MESTSPPTPAPLLGLRVIDMGQVLATPFATYLLGLLGAEIIKVEPHGGEWFRQVGTGLAFETQNGDKRSISVDMRAPGAADVILRLTETADVFVEGFAPGTANAMGLGFDAVKARNPNIVYGSLSAFGDTGPYANRPSFDHVVQAHSGAMPATGFEGQPPLKVGSPYLDYGSGMLLAYGLLAGILEQRRTGQAVRIDVAMLDAALLFHVGHFVRAANTGENPARSGNDAYSGAVVAGAFDSADGMIMVAANKPTHYVKVMEVLGLDELATQTDLTFPRADPDRVRRARQAVQERFATDSAAAWETRLIAVGVPAARVRTMVEVHDEGHAQARGLLTEVPSPDGDHPTVRLTGAGVKINGVMPSPQRPAPAIGADTVDVLAGVGYSEAEIDQLVSDGVIRVDGLTDA